MEWIYQTIDSCSESRPESLIKILENPAGSLRMALEISGKDQFNRFTIELIYWTI